MLCVWVFTECNCFFEWYEIKYPCLLFLDWLQKCYDQNVTYWKISKLEIKSVCSLDRWYNTVCFVQRKLHLKLMWNDFLSINNRVMFIASPAKAVDSFVVQNLGELAISKLLCTKAILCWVRRLNVDSQSRILLVCSLAFGPPRLETPMAIEYATFTLYKRSLSLQLWETNEITGPNEVLIIFECYDDNLRENYATVKWIFLDYHHNDIPNI